MTYDIVCADVLDWAARYEGPPFHAILCDPPYGWHFMNRKKADGNIALRPETWQALAQHLLPGAFIFAFAGPRTYHRLACAMEDARLRLHGPLIWINAQGFPKATRVDLAIDRAAGKEDDRKIIGRRYPPPDSDFWAKGFDEKDIKKHQDEPTGTYSGNCGLGAPIIEPATDLARIWQDHRYGLQSLKPCVELIAVAQKPYAGKPVDSIVATGAGALNIEAGRIGVENISAHGGGNNATNRVYGAGKDVPAIERGANPHSGRWPPSLVLSHVPDHYFCAACGSIHPMQPVIEVCPDCGGALEYREGCRRVGVKRVKSASGGDDGVNHATAIWGNTSETMQSGRSYADPDGFEQVDAWQCARGPGGEMLCPVERLDEAAGERVGSHDQIHREGTGKSQVVYGELAFPEDVEQRGHNDSGGPSRFYYNADFAAETTERLAQEDPFRYCPKAAKSERQKGLDDFYWRRDKSSPSGFVRVSKEEWESLDKKERARGNIHSTVKPISLLVWLCKLLSPPPEYAPRRLLIPFSGSGSEIVSAMLTGWEEIVGIELLQDYVDISEARCAFWAGQSRQMELSL